MGLTVPQHQLRISGNTAGATASLSSGTVTLAGGNGITLSQAGNAVTISGAAAAAAQTAISGIAASNTTYTSGTVSLTGVGGGVTVSSNTGQRVDISVAAPVAQTVQTQNVVDVSLSGNTAGALALISSGTLTLAGGNNITLSQAGNAITVSGPNTVAGQTFSGGMSTMGNTSGNTGYATQRLNLVGGNNITLSGSTNAGSMTITVSGAAAGGAQTAISGIAASNTTYTSGSVTFTGVGGGVTVSSNTGQRVDISVAAQSVQPETQTFVGGIGNSQTTYTSGTVNLSVVAGNLTIRSTTGQAFQFSASQTVQPETQTFLGALAASNTTYTSGTVTITGVGGGITVSSNTGQRIDLSVAAQTTQTQGILSAGVSTGGNTSGNTTVNTGSRMVFVGSNNITLSQGTAAGATTITISGPSVAGAQTGISGIANSQTTYTSGTVSLSELGAITIRSTTGQQFQLSVNAQTTQTQGILSAGVSTGGNTAGNTTVNTGSRLVLVGSGNLTASQGTAAGASTITLSVAAQSVQPETQTFVGGIAASNTTYTSGTISITGVGGGVTVSSNTGQRVDISVAAPVAQTTQTQGILSAGVSNLGNTAGNTTVNTGSRLVLVGTNMVSLSQTTGAGATTISINATQSVQPETQTAISGIANSQTTYTSGTVSLSELGAITVRSTTGNQFQLSVNAYSAGISTNGNTLGDTGFASHRLALIGGNNITLSGSTNAGSMSLTISGPAAGGAQTGISGIANSQTTYTSGTVSLSELGAITIRSTTGNQYQLSVNAQSVQPETQTFLAGIQNSQTTYTSGTVNLSVVAGNLTIRSTTGQAFQFSASQSVQPETQTAISGIANSQTTYTSGTVSWSELGAVTIRSTTGNQYQISVNSQTVQTQGIGSLGVSTGGNTAGNTQVSTGSRIVFAGVGDISLSQATAAGASTISISGSQSVQTQGIGSIGVSTGGNTAGNTTVNTGTRFVLVGSNMISLSQATAAGASTVTLNATQSVQTQSNIQALYDGANSITTGTVRLTDANGVTFSVNAQTLSASVNQSISMHAVSNTTQSTSGTAHKSALSFGGAGIASVGVTGGSVVISVPAGGGAGDGGVFAGVSTGGNTAGSTGTVSTGNFVLVGTGPISLSQSTGAAGSAATVSINAPATSSLSATGVVSISTNASTISIGVPSSSLSATGNIEISSNASTISIGDGGNVLNFWDNMVPGGSASSSFQLSDAALNIYPMNPANAGFPGYMSVQSVFFDMSGTVSTAASFTRSLSFGIYTMVNSTQLSLMASASTSWGTNAANAGVNNSFGGRRWVSLHSSLFNNAPNFAAGSDYFLGIWHRSSSGSQTFAFLGQVLPYGTGVRSGFMSVASATNTTLGHYPFLGNYSVSFATAMPNALAASDVNKSNATAVSLPRVIFNNIGSNII